MIGRLIKADFYRAAQSRRIAFSDQGRLVGLIMDEYPLVVTGAEGRFGDIVQLQSLRSKRAFVVAATQGFANLDMIIGERARNALLINFNNLFLLNSHEAQVDHFAQAHFGKTPRCIRSATEVEEEDALGGVSAFSRTSRLRVHIDDWICPPGQLSQLAPNQAFVSLARGRRLSEAVWIVPLFHDVKLAAAAPQLANLPVSMKVAHEARRALAEELSAIPETSEPGFFCCPAEDAAIGTECRPEAMNEQIQHESAQRHEAAPDKPVCIWVNQAELEVLLDASGIIALFQASHSDHAAHLSIVPIPDGAAGHMLLLSWSGLHRLLKLRASSPAAKALKKLLRKSLRGQGRQPA